MLVCKTQRTQRCRKRSTPFRLGALRATCGGPHRVASVEIQTKILKEWRERKGGEEIIKHQAEKESRDKGTCGRDDRKRGSAGRERRAETDFFL